MPKTSQNSPQVSLVIPVRNEAGNIGPLLKEIAAALDAADFRWEVLVIDDGSTDGSAAEVTAAAANDSRIACLPLTNGSGKSAALALGFAKAQGIAVVMLDGDGQDDPAEIPCMLAQLGLASTDQLQPVATAELVNGWKTPRLDPWHKTMPSRVFNLLVSWLTGLWLHDHNCGLKAMHREVAQQLPLTTGMHRFIPVLAAAAGGRVVEQPVHHRPRTRGVSKYGFTRFFHGLFDLIHVWLALQTGRLTTTPGHQATADPTRGLRWTIYGLLAAIALGGVLGRIGTVASVDRLALEKRLIDDAVKRRLAKAADAGSPIDPTALRQELTETIRTEKRLLRPFLSGNDRSRWLTIRSLVERGSFAIEELVTEPGWDTIDAVVHPGADGRLHLYSSKPPLLPVLLAGPYWLAHRMTGWTLGDHPFELGRLLLVFFGLLPLAVTPDRSGPALGSRGHRLWHLAQYLRRGAQQSSIRCGMCCGQSLGGPTDSAGRPPWLGLVCHCWSGGGAGSRLRTASARLDGSGGRAAGCLRLAADSDSSPTGSCPGGRCRHRHQHPCPWHTAAGLCLPKFDTDHHASGHGQ
jgi:hypothetical protein